MGVRAKLYSLTGDELLGDTVLRADQIPHSIELPVVMFGFRLLDGF